MSGIYQGPGGEPLHGDGKPVGQPYSRAERREAGREARKDFEAIVKTLKGRLAERADDAFKQAVMTATQHLELEPGANNVIAVTMLDGCIDCVERGDEATAKLLFYVAGVIPDPNLVRLTCDDIELGRVRRNKLVLPGQPSS